MIAPCVVHEIRRLLDEGKLSQRKIARTLRVSRGTVGAIASGKRLDYEALWAARNNGVNANAGPPARCPDCGGMVYLPCRLCRTRARLAASPRRRPRAGRNAPPLVLQLKDEHRRRYEMVLVRKVLEKDAAG